eukprot:sb/3468115/
MDGIGFTDEELGRLNTPSPKPTHGQIRGGQMGSHGQIRGQIGEQKRKTNQGQGTVRSKQQLVVTPKQPNAPTTAAVVGSETLVVGTSSVGGAGAVRGSGEGTVEPQEGDEKAVPEDKSVMIPTDVEPKPKPDTPAEATENIHDDDVNPFASDDHAEDIQQPPKTKIETLQQKQVTLERQNRERQKALKATLSERFHRTAEQAKLLQTMQAEVTSIERELSCDISLLRDRIDRCNMRYSEARLVISNAPLLGQTAEKQSYPNEGATHLPDHSC